MIAAGLTCTNCLMTCVRICPPMRPTSVGKTGTYCSFSLFASSVIVSILCQRYAADIPITEWSDGCDDETYAAVCRSNSAVFRISFALVIFFFIQALACYFTTAYVYDIAWPIKIVIYVCMVIGFFFANSNTFDAHGYAWYARFAGESTLESCILLNYSACPVDNPTFFFFAVGFFFVIIQQVILLDLAYIWNEKWVNYATDKDSGSSSLLTCLVVICLSVYAMCGTAIGVMYWTFTCSQNLAILSITVILCFLATFYQLFMTERGSLLTSAIMTGYATYLCYSSISLDPHPECNPTIGNASQNWSQIMGMCLTAISVSICTERYLLLYYSLRHIIIIYTISYAGLLGVLYRK